MSVAETRVKHTRACEEGSCRALTLCEVNDMLENALAARRFELFDRNRCRPSWTSRFLDLGDKESAIPFPRWRATFLFRDMAHQAVPCHFAKEIDAH
jgi:hypothetical protein